MIAGEFDVGITSLPIGDACRRVGASRSRVANARSSQAEVPPRDCRRRCASQASALRRGGPPTRRLPFGTDASVCCSEELFQLVVAVLVFSLESEAREM